MGRYKDDSSGALELPRARPCMATFADALLVPKLKPGANGIGAVLGGWTNPIAAHDAVVLEVEAAIEQERRLAADLKAAERAAVNWGVAFVLVNENPAALEEYRQLKCEMTSYEKRREMLGDTPAKVGRALLTSVLKLTTRSNGAASFSYSV